MYHYLVFVPLALIFSAAALALPWFIVRAGYRDLVQITCACVSVLGLCAATGVFSYFDNKPLAFLYGCGALACFLYGCGALACFLYAVDCAIPLYMTRKKPRKQL
ncbi:TPA_asm: cobalamin biosynthesis protein CbiX [Salmonella enterica subsp. enterica serovar Typhimurium]|nr:cobalamin biosynthesis protein CbiX [Salmonella enterica subsp. enterica serovar Typhimurium]